jgi:DNA-binding MarR family transcriptional regulator
MRDILSNDVPLFFLFKNAHHQLVVGASREIAEATSAPPAQIAALTYLDRQDGLRVQDLGGQLGLGSAGATGLVARLVRKGYVRRSTHPQDRRATTLRITARGRRVAANARPALAGFSRRMAAGLSTEELAVVRRFLHHVAATFNHPNAADEP